MNGKDLPLLALFALTLSLPAIGLAVQQEKAGKIVSPGRTVTVTEVYLPMDTDRGGLFLTRFDTEPSEEELSALQSNGLELLEYLGDLTYWARLEEGSTFPSLPGSASAVRAVPEDKITLPAQRILAREKADRPRKWIVSFFGGTSIGEAKRLLKKVDAKLLDDRMLFGNRMLIELPSEAVRGLASSELVCLIELPPGRKQTKNATAAKLTLADYARRVFSVDGTGVRIGIWDGGKVENHTDLAGRVVIAQDVTRSSHATHVAGTIAGSGAGEPKATGMAPGAVIVSYDYEDDVPTEISSARDTYGIHLANNSWGYTIGWEYDDNEGRWEWWGSDEFGYYHSESAAYDQLIYKKKVTIVFAAGNDREDTGPSDGSYYDAIQEKEITSDNPPPPDGPYSVIDLCASAKNVIAVGATDKINQMSGFSSWGPTQDGRIKPEVTATGVRLFSTVLNNNYDISSGTSMSTPVVTGGIALLYEMVRNGAGGKNPSTAVIRALIAATAQDLGNPGPDYSFGFGLLDFGSATRVVSLDAANNVVVEGAVKKPKRKRTKLYRMKLKRGTKFLKVALAWIDPPAAPGAAETLVNDLDLKITGPKGEGDHLPWTLDGDNPSLPAVRGTNDTDNIELVEVAEPSKGIWTIEVTAARFGKGRKQKFALVVYTDKKIKGQVTELSQAIQ